MTNLRHQPPEPPAEALVDPALEAELTEITAAYPERRAGALMCLHHVQAKRGALGLPEQRLVARVLGISPAHVRELVSFYTMFRPEPAGRWHLQLCRTLSCALRGAGALREQVRARLGIGPNESTADGLFTLTEVECLASCGTAPVVQINDDYHEDLSPESFGRLLEDLRGRRPAPGGSGA